MPVNANYFCVVRHGKEEINVHLCKPYNFNEIHCKQITASKELGGEIKTPVSFTCAK